MSRKRRILFLCTGNSARSQIAEALVKHKAPERFQATSAGSKPAAAVNPLAVDVLKQIGIDWRGREPKGLDRVMHEPWDLIITVCDRAKEACPVFPGKPAAAHWGMDDPAEAEGTPEERARAFVLARQLLSRRIDLLLALPLEKLDRLALEQRVGAISAENPPVDA